MRYLCGLVVFLGTITMSLSVYSAELSCKFLNPIEEGYLNQHITVKSRDGLEKKLVKKFLKKLDSSKLYLHKADIESIEKKFVGIFGKIKKKDCSVLDNVHALYLKRVKERAAFAKKHLGKGFKFNKKTQLVLDPDEREYPTNKAKADEFQKKYIQFQISNYLVTDMKLDEAKQNVIRGYERLVKRVKEMDKEYIYANYYLDSFAHALDPHSSFFSKDVLEDFEISMRLSLEGIGATLSSKDGFTTIEQLIPGGAAARSGSLKPKDKIIAVGQGETGPLVNVVEEELRDVVRKIRGKKGTQVRLSILRKIGSEKSRFEVTLVRDKIKLEDEAARIHYFDKEVDGKKEKYAVLDLPSFYADSRRGGRSAAKDMKKLLLEANRKNVKGLVLDFSSNGGGSLDDAVKIAGLFFRTGNVVKQSSRDPARGNQSLQDTDPTVNWNKPLVVLISRVSASASEIVAGTLKDYKRAVIVGGDHTFGKGSVQSVVPIPNELGALKVTVGMFFIPGGHSTQHRGVETDVPLPNLYSNDEIGEKTLDYSLPPKALEPFISKQAYVTEGPSTWKMVQESEITELKKRSKARVAKNKKFKEILEDIKKSKKKDKLVKLDEVLKEKDKKNKDKKGEDKDKVLTAKETRAKKTKEYRERADVNEAVNVLVDLVSLKKGKTFPAIGKKVVEEKEFEISGE